MAPDARPLWIQFPSNPDQTQLNKQNKAFGITNTLQAGVLFPVIMELWRTVPDLP